MKCLRVMFNINWRDHVTNHEIAARASRPEGYIVEIVQHRQHTWLGHVLRMDGNRLPKMSLQAHHTMSDVEVDRERAGLNPSLRVHA